MKIPVILQAVLFLAGAAIFLLYNFFVKSSGIVLMLGSFCLTIGIVTLIKGLSNTSKNSHQDSTDL